VPQIPAYLIELFSERGDVVYDPFCGIGTTLVEALRLGRRTVGVDLNEIASLVAKTKTFFIGDDELRRRESAFVSRLENEQAAHGMFGDMPLLKFKPSPGLRRLGARFDRIKPWYHETTFYELVLLRELIREEEGSFQRLLIVTFSQMLKGLSSSRHWGWVADNVLPDTVQYAGALQVFRQDLSAFVGLFREFLANPQLRNVSLDELNTRCTVIRADTLQGSPLARHSVDLVVTSPPYVNVTDYTMAQRLSLEWMEIDLCSSKASEVGARWKRFRRGAVEDYFCELETCIRNVLVALKPDGYFCVVLGGGQHRGKRVDAISRLRSIAHRCGLNVAFPEIVRSPTRQRLRDREGRANKEHILIFKRG
jgi:DNA modification methylase